MALDKKLFKKEAAAAATPSGTGNQEDGLILYYDANDVDSYDGDGSVWYDITNHEYTPEIDPAENFNTVLYTGTSSTNAITGVGFAPDFVWIKGRNYSDHHGLFDTVRGDHMMLASSANSDTTTNNTTLTSFDDDGFTLGTDASDRVNDATKTYVAWCLKAGGAPTATNTATSGAMTSNSVSIDGELKSAYTPSGSPDIYPEKMSINTKLGFSIIKYDGSNAQETFPHGLGVKPELVIFKRINTAASWLVTDGTQMGYLDFNSSFTTTRHNTYIASMDANTIELKGVAAINGSGDEMIAYCFASKRGVSKVGSYTGTGSTGHKIYTGFEPAWVMVKKTSSTGNWIISDQVRGIDREVYPNLTNIDNTDSNGIQSYNADGFTLGTGGDWNQSGQTFIYLAFAAEKPDSLIDDTDLEQHLDPTTYSGSGTTWTADVGGDATLNGNMAYDQELGDFFDLDGTSDYASFTPTADFSGDYTLELWINPHENNNFTYYYAKQSASTNGLLVGNFAGSTGQLEVYRYNTSGTASSGTFTGSGITANKWNHVVIVFSGSNGYLYVNGEQKDSSTSFSSTYPSSFTTFRLGGSYSTSYDTNGELGQFRIYEGALTAAEVMQNYRFTRNDYPNGQNGTFSGLTSSDWNSNGYFDFPTGTDRIELDFDGIDFNQTLVMWVNLGANTNADSNSTYRYYLYSQYTGSNYQYFNVAIYDKSSGGNHLNISWRDSSSSYYFLEDDVDSDFGSGWNMVAVYISGTESVYYSINGNDWTQATLGFGDLGTENVIPTGNVILSGYRGNTSIISQANPFSMSQLKVYDKVLTSSELSALNTAGYQG